MSVDMSVAVGVGFIVDPEALKEYRTTIPNNDFYDDSELLEMLLANTDGLTFGAGGSYYTGELVHWIAIKRLTKSYYTYEIPGMVVGLSKPVITLSEREALTDVARFLGNANPELGQFMSVLWS